MKQKEQSNKQKNNYFIALGLHCSRVLQQPMRAQRAVGRYSATCTVTVAFAVAVTLSVSQIHQIYQLNLNRLVYC